MMSGLLIKRRVERKRRVKHFVDDLPSEVVFLDSRTNFSIWLLEKWGFHWLHFRDASNDTVHGKTSETQRREGITKQSNEVTRNRVLNGKKKLKGQKFQNS